MRTTSFSKPWAAAVVGLGTAGIYVAWRAVRNPIHVVWDLDAVVISSQCPLVEAVEKFPAAQFSNYFDQIDDDFPFQEGIPNTRTFWRPGVRLLITLLRPFAIQYVFTSAQATYCDNVMKRLDPTHSIFRQVIHRDIFEPPHQLGRIGKDIAPLLGLESLNDKTKKAKALAQRAILLDDQPRYHKAQPQNGLLVKPFVDVKEGDNYTEVLRIGWVLCHCFFAHDVRSVLTCYKGKHGTW